MITRFKVGDIIIVYFKNSENVIVIDEIISIHLTKSEIYYKLKNTKLSIIDYKYSNYIIDFYDYNKLSDSLKIKVDKYKLEKNFNL